MRSYNWIDELTPTVRDAVLRCAHPRTVADSKILYQSGDRVTEIFQIVSGAIRKCIITEDGQEVLLHVYGPGDIVADSPVASDESSPVTLTTRGETRLRVWSASDLRQLRDQHQEVDMALACQISRRLRDALRLIEELLTLPVAARIASRFAQLSDLGKPSERGVDLMLSQVDIGLMVGSTRQSVSRVVNELRELGLIEPLYGKIIIKDRPGLNRYVREHHRSSEK
ncbi:Crp/Fnr family transcriptional regulator [Pseudomonas sp. RGM2987]|uniref:Crp/Fnr family transcriptional regulator n=1 Tax=Pseudomonas sp. RGM2987 TaxID=2930090 RepID=UPI001FD6E6A2|nr:Crp/Fnr family transcriptional regulator [Pseudomonas sp. RGM2987]MCJ8206822.1 Crp/Fnr family transcriptional regulator [Pseudomonas sp. RGM2987]